jgi:hypothetical protein
MTEYYDWQINRIPLPDGQYGVVCYFRDVSAHVHARARLETADPSKGRIPRDARARAAQSARAVAQRGRGPHTLDRAG